MPQSKPWLIISESGRALAVSAARAGLETLVIDRFADTDTCAVAQQVRQVPGNAAGLVPGEVIKMLDEYEHVDFAGVVVGSGLEAHPEILEQVSARWPLYGNTVETVKCCKDPAFFFSALQELQIAHPSTLMKESADNGNWLLKAEGHAGGRHVSRYLPGTVVPEGYYLQKETSGRTVSAVFLADGVGAILAGMNEIYAAEPDAGDFRYVAAVTLSDEARLREIFRNIIHALTQKFSLKGLCGVDAVVNVDGGVEVLEINPRPTSTFELHEGCDSLFARHILACAGELKEISPPVVTRNRGHRIIYADQSFILPEVSWPSWTTDRPASGKLIDRGEPVCSVHAEEDTSENVLQLLKTRTEHMENLLGLRRLAA